MLIDISDKLEILPTFAVKKDLYIDVNTNDAMLSYSYEGRNNCSKTIFLQFFLALKTNKKFFLSISFNFCGILKTKN